MNKKGSYFNKGLMCLSTSGNYTQVEILTLTIFHLVVRAVHRHRTGVGSIPAGGPIVDEFFSTVPGKNFDLCIISTRTFKTH